MGTELAYRTTLDTLIEQTGEDEFQAMILAAVLEGASPRDLAKTLKTTYATLWTWLTEDEDRYKAYQSALQGTADDIAWESLKISDEADGDEVNVAAKKLRVETRMKLAGKWDRHRYGEQTNVQVGGSVSLISLLASLPSGNEIEGESERIENGG